MGIIKPLEWKWSPWGGQHSSQGLANYTISDYKSGDLRQSLYCGHKRLTVCANEEDAKTAAEKHWIFHLSKMLNLEEVSND